MLVTVYCCVGGSLLQYRKEIENTNSFWTREIRKKYENLGKQCEHTVLSISVLQFYCVSPCFAFFFCTWSSRHKFVVVLFCPAIYQSFLVLVRLSSQKLKNFRPWVNFWYFLIKCIGCTRELDTRDFYVFEQICVDNCSASYGPIWTKIAGSQATLLFQSNILFNKKLAFGFHQLCSICHRISSFFM